MKRASATKQARVTHGISWPKPTLITAKRKAKAQNRTLSSYVVNLVEIDNRGAK